MRGSVDVRLHAHPLDFQANDFEAEMILSRISQPLKLQANYPISLLASFDFEIFDFLVVIGGHPPGVVLVDRPARSTMCTHVPRSLKSKIFVRITLLSIRFQSTL